MLNRKIINAFIIVILLLALGTFYFQKNEGWSYVDSFYFSTITLTTIGYGDLVPTQPHTKLFASFYAIFGIGVMLYLLGSVIGVYLVQQEENFGKLFSRLRARFHRKNEKNTNKKSS